MVYNFIKKRFREYCEIFKYTYFEEHLQEQELLIEKITSSAKEQTENVGFYKPVLNKIMISHE